MDSTYTGRTVNKQLLLNSWQIGSGTQTDFTQNLQNPIVNARAIHFLSFVMPNFIRPFTTRDNIFYYFYDNVSKTITLDASQFYPTIQSFCDYITTVLAANGTPITISQTVDPSPGTGVASPYTLTGTATVGHTWRPINYKGEVAYEANFKIGFADPVYANALTQVASGFPNVILRTNSISIQTNLTGSTHSAGRDFTTIFAVPIGSSVPGTMISFTNPYRIEFPTIVPSISSVTIKMVDDDGYELNIPSNCYMTLALAVECDA
jgi:hypothetical protein